MAENGGAESLADPFLLIRAADMSIADAEITEDGAVAVHTGSALSLGNVDFATGAAILRLQAKAPAEGRLGIRIYLDGTDGPVFATAFFTPITKESRIPVTVEGVHDVTLVFEGEGTFSGWQVFTSVQEIEALIRAEHSGKYEDSIPTRYLVRCEHEGTVELFTYETHDYANNREVYEKTACVYLPYGYDPAQTYRLLILCHGVGGNEYEWGLNEGPSSRVKCMMDNLIEGGEIRPFIVVTPNGRAGRTSDTSSFYLFDQELRNDLLPALAERYAVDIHDREMCAMAGLSMGGMQTLSLGMEKCLDLFSAYGVFSGATGSPATVAAKLNASDLPIRVFYNICGTEDSVVTGFRNIEQIGALTDKLDENNFIVQYVPGGHDFGVWYLGFYNFARLFGAE
jgi:endo-1,4-beta-xylanase